VGTSGETTHPGEVLQLPWVEQKQQSVPQFGSPRLHLAAPASNEQIFIVGFNSSLQHLLKIFYTKIYIS
jgi:hypothetical protein